jgi:hypothetical protein
MAAGNPKPMVPRPPELMKVRGFRALKYKADHIWFCPTSVVTIELSAAISISSKAFGTKSRVNFD